MTGGAAGPGATGAGGGEGGAPVVRVVPERYELLAGFLRETWDPGATVEKVARARRLAARENPLEPGEEVPTFLFVDGDRAIGHLTTIPVRVWRRGSAVAGHWTKGLMVLPEHRNGPVGFYVLKEAVDRLGLLMAMVVQPEARRLFTALGFRDLGALSNHVKVLRPRRVVRRIDPERLGLDLPAWARSGLRVARAPFVDRIVATLLRLALAVRGRTASGTRGLERIAPPRLEEDGTAVWRRARDAVSAGTVRDGAYLARRYGGREADRYATVAIRDGEGPVGLVVVRRPREDGDPRLRGVRVATLSEVIFPPERPGDGLAALRAAEEAARRLDADAVLCSAGDPRLSGPLRKRGFATLPGNVHFLLRDADRPDRWPGSLDAWWLTRGDGDADEVF